METVPSSDPDFSDSEGSEYAGPARGKKKMPAPAPPLPSPAPPKKARTTAQASKPTRKGRGKVKIGVKITEFPLDALYEILSYVEPSDLLSMSRVNTSFRAALATKSSRFVWKNAIENAEMPPCPEDISEIHYAHFVLDPYCDHCHTIGRKGQLLYDYYSREKICKSCFGAKFKEIHSWRWYCRLVPTIEIQCKPRRGRETETYANSRKVSEIIKKSQSFGSDNAAFKEWDNSIRAEAEKLYQLEKPLKAWLVDKEAEGVSRKKDLRQARWDAILDKLGEEGYGEELETLKEGRIDNMDSLKNLKCVKIAASLTQKAWDRIKPDVISFMQGIREALAAELRQKLEERGFPVLIEAFSDYISAQPHDPYGPQCADIAGLPEIQALVQIPLEDPLDKEDFARCLETSFDTLKSSWRASVEAKLLKMMQDQIPEATMDDLWSPAAMFSCNDCRAWLHTSSTLTHTRCARRYDSKFGLRLPTVPWEEASFKFNHEAYLKAILALQKFESTPTSNMLSLELFHCLECSQRKGRRVLMSWKEAISGSSSCISQDHPIQPVTLTSEEEIFKDLYVDMKLLTSDRHIICASCREWRSIAGCQFEQHQIDRHGKTQDLWIEGVDFYRTADILEAVFFADEFVPNDKDIRSAMFKFAKNSNYPRFSLDLRTDSRFAAENYCYPVRA